MNLRYMTNIGCRLSLILIALFALQACSGGGSESGQTQNSINTASSNESRDSYRGCDDDDDDCDRHDDHEEGHDDHEEGHDDHEEGHDDHEEGGGTSAVLNIIAVHNPSSSQYDDNCLNCHSDIPNAQSLSAAIPDAHVAMLAFTPGEESDQCTWCHRDVSNTLIHTAAQVGAFQNNIRKTVDAQLCAICHGPVGPGKPFYQAGLTTSPDPDGSQLYRYLCSTCHKALADSEVKGESAEEIYKAISGDEGGMAPLSVLNPQWVQAITVALGGDPTLPPSIPAPGTGASLYQQYCSSCHGGLASSSKTGATAARIQNGIDTEPQMSSLSFLTSTQVQDIADALSGGGTGGGGGGGLPASHTDDKGGALHMPGKDTPYSSGCTACHGTTLQGDIGPSCFTCHDQKWSEDPPSGGGGTGGTVGTDGAALYAQYCEACHNSLNNSNQSGASAALIQNGINNVGEMSSLTFLSAAQVQAISDALNGVTGGGGTGGGGTGGGGSGGLPASHTDEKGGALHMPGKDTPFSSGCTDCHGETLQGDLGPSCFSCHDDKWN